MSLVKHLPVMSSLGHLEGTTLRSCKGTSTPSTFPNIDDKPRQKSMMKKRMDHRGETGILVIASVKTIKAKPVPSTPCVRFQKLQKLASLTSQMYICIHWSWCMLQHATIIILSFFFTKISKCSHVFTVIIIQVLFHRTKKQKAV